MRVLHTADWHLGRTLEGRSRLEEQAAFVEELVRIAEDQRVDLVLIAGDVYDTVNPPAAAELLFYEAVNALAAGGRRKVVVIAGNHDNPDRVAAAGPLAGSRGIMLEGWPGSSVLRIGCGRTGEEAVVYPLPYPSESRLRELLAREPEEGELRSAYSRRIGQLTAAQASAFTPGTVNIIVSHLYVTGGRECDSERPIQVGGAYTVDPEALCAGAQYVALGHLHRPQNIKGSALIRYSGSPLAYSFSEAGQAKSVTVLDMQPGRQPEWEEIYLSSGRPLVRWQAKEGLGQVWDWIEGGRDSRAWIELELHMAEALGLEQIHRLRKAQEGLVLIRPVYPDISEEETGRTTERLPVDEMFRRFYQRQTGGAAADEETVKLFLELLEEEAEA